MVVLRCKVAVVGEGTVGKSSMVQMFLTGGTAFPRNYQMTMGVDFGVKEVEIDQDTTVELYIFDIAGADMYRGIIDQYLQNISAFVFVYDASNKFTFEAAKSWTERCRKARKDLPGACVANKIDLDERIEVQPFQGQALSKAQGMEFFQTSALRSQNVTAPFEHIARQFHKTYADTLRARKNDL
ncbi:Intraflagellar transport protein 27-like protein [Diplonema papillatum]|nr:Intraflagellar transport protein 27-like protein [Diplonema papillatum]